MTAKKALKGLTDEEREKSIEILKIVDGMEVSRVNKILVFCKEMARDTAIIDASGLFFC